MSHTPPLTSFDPPDAPLDDSAAGLLAGLEALGGSELDGLTADEARATYAALSAAGAERRDDATVETRQVIAGVPVYVVRPADANPDGSRLPVLVWCHGGGWVIGSAEMTLTMARYVARTARCVVVSVDYRLAPEHRFPAAVVDVEAVTRAVFDSDVGIGGDPARVAVGGDSAGGNLAAVVAMKVPGLCLQLLVYPVTDARLGHPSMTTNGEGRLLTSRSMRWFVDHYLDGADPNDPRVSPLLAQDSDLAAGPPAWVLTAGHDPLRDEGLAYARRLREVGVPVVSRHWPGQIHGFFGFAPVIPEGQPALEEAVEALVAAWR